MVKIVVIGCGVLGMKIAGALAYDGHEVRVHDSNSSLLNKVYLKLNEDRRILREDGLMINSNFLGDVYCFSNLEDAVRGASFIFECIPENLALKKEVFKKIEQHCPPNAIISSSSMRVSIDEIIEDVKIKERCLGIRFLYPVYFIPEVELLPAKQTSLEALEKVRRFLERINKVAFFRSGCEPIVLTEEQREARRNAFLRQLQEQKSIGRILNLPIPDLGALNGFGDGGNTQTDYTEVEPQSSRENECVVCMDSERDCVLHPCHHLCTCIQCGRLLLKRQDACPICRRTISNVFRVYHS